MRGIFPSKGRPSMQWQGQARWSGKVSASALSGVSAGQETQLRNPGKIRAHTLFGQTRESCSMLAQLPDDTPAAYSPF